MPIVADDIHIRLSGGLSNSNPNTSLGGNKSSNSVTLGLHNLFDVVTSDQALNGLTDYRCVYVQNTHPTLTYYGAKASVLLDTASPQTTLQMGLGTSAINGTEQTIASATTMPTGVSFVVTGTVIELGDLGPGDSRAIWLRRMVDAGTSAINNDTATIIISGDTTE